MSGPVTGGATEKAARASSDSLNAVEIRVLRQLLLEVGSSEAYRKAFRRRIRVWAERRFPGENARSRNAVRAYVHAFDRLTDPEVSALPASLRREPLAARRLLRKILD